VRTPFGTVALTRAPSENRESTRVDAKTSVLVPIEFGDRVLRPLLTSRAPLLPPKPDAKAKPAVIIDPGHGGNDWGASLDHDGVTVREKDLVLEIARALRDELAKSKISAALTRDADLYLTLPERTRLANASGAKAFLSLHLNSEPSAKTRGFELYVLSLKGGESDARAAVALENQIIPEDASQEVERALAELRSEANFEASLGLAKAVAAPLKKAHKAHGTGVKTGPFYVLYGAEMPALLVEWGFLTQPEERKALLDPAARDRWVRAVAQGLGLWLKTAR
jgi:N-acetylmuramoyl-L-alanine amidase